MLKDGAECDSLADGKHRRLREEGKSCECKDDWGGINCNGRPFFCSLHLLIFESSPWYLVCKSDNACIGFPLAGGISSLDDGNANMTCYTGGETVFNNHQMCNVTSPSPFVYKSSHSPCQLDRKILDMLPGRPPQVTFSCETANATCAFQFWTAEVESFYCSLDKCKSEKISGYDRNSTVYSCEHIKCSCVTGRFICGENGSVGRRS